MTSKPAYALAACAVDLSTAGAAPTEIRLLPAGPFRSVDTRPAECAAWQLSAETAARLIATAAARASDYVIDFEHQTLRSAENGQPAPAAGWFKTLEFKADGLYATDVRWTANAARMIAAGEYRYLSPVFAYHPASGAVTALSLVAPASLVNAPGLDGLTDLAQLAAPAFPPVLENPMEEILAQLKALLKLPDGAQPPDVLAALDALIAEENKEPAEPAEPAALAAKNPDPAQFVALAIVDGLRAEFAEKTAALGAEVLAYRQKERAALLAQALADGLISPAEVPWAQDLIAQNAASFAALCAVRAPIVALGTAQTGGKKPAGAPDAPTALSADDAKVAQMLGQTPEKFAQHKKGC